MSTAYYRLGLTGYPLEHSLSPRLHTAALQACGLQGEYLIYPVPPGDDAGLRALLESVRGGALHGLNVTIPHKRSVLPLLDEVSETVKAIGAVNTIYARDGALVGENTDAPGFLSDLERWLPDVSSGVAPTQVQGGTRQVGLVLGAAPTQVQGGTRPVQERDGIQPLGLVLGAGGSARAAVYALVQAGWQVVVAARRVEQAQEVRRAISEQVEALALDGEVIRRLAAERRVRLVVNATPLGMGERVEESAWPDGALLPGMAFVYDLVYNPPETALMRAARDAGLACTNGLGMLVDQARLAFWLWTGREVERAVMERAVGL